MAIAMPGRPLHRRQYLRLEPAAQSWKIEPLCSDRGDPAIRILHAEAQVVDRDGVLGNTALAPQLPSV